MSWSSAELVISAASAVQYPPTELSHILMVGRSNVGKSSIINALTQRKKLAYVGNKPGKTTLLNFYNINNEFMLVDAPGYGYANRTRGDLIRYGKMMNEFFSDKEELLLRSYDAPVSSSERERLSSLMQNDYALRRMDDQYLKICELLIHPEPDSFGPFFAERIVHQLKHRAREIDYLIFFFFKK